MKSHFLLPLAALLADVSIQTASADNPSFTCAMSEGGKRLTLRGSNTSSNSISCSSVKCEAFINVPDGKRQCEITTPFKLPPNTSGQEIGSCFDDAHPATTVIGVGFSC